MKLTKPVVVAVVSDLHTNSTIGLAPPRVSLDDGGEYKASKAQRWLWNNWRDFWRRARATADEHQATLLAVVNGDALDGDHHNTPQIITRNVNDQLAIAAATLAPVMETADAWYMIRGTEAHAGQAASFEEHLAADCGAVPDASDHHARWHLYARWGGVTFDIKHHPESGSVRPWTKGNGANRISEIVRHAYWSTGDNPPDVVIRSHRHGFEDSSRLTRGVYSIITAPWQLTTSFGYRIGAGSPQVAAVGGLLFVCQSGHYTVEQVTYSAKRVRPEGLPELVP